MRLPALALEQAPRGGWSRLARALRRLGYGFEPLRRDLRLPDTLDVFVQAWDERSFPAAAAALRSFRPRSRSERLAAALFLSRPLPPQAWRGLFSPEELSLLRKTGLLSRTGSFWVFNLALCPYRGLYFLVDSLPRLRQLGWDQDDLPGGVVYFLGPDSLLLAEKTSRKPVDACADLCTGSGVQAVLASLHSQSVTAVDVDPRAVSVARANCALNAADNVSVVQGDLWSAVPQDRTFDLALANPPILPSRATRKLWRDGGRDGNALCRRIARELPVRLRSGGRCQMTAATGFAQWLSSRAALRRLGRRWTPYPRVVSGNWGLAELSWP